MRLSEILKTILSTERQDDVDCHGRREQRFGVRAPLLLRLLVSGAPVRDEVKVWLRDLSAGGCCIISHRQMVAGQKFLLRMPESAGNGEVDLCYEAVRCDQVADSVFEIGAKRAAAPEKRIAAANPATGQKPPAAAQTEAERISAAMLGR